MAGVLTISRRAHRSICGGFTLIEVLIALAILSLAGMTLVDAHLGSMHLWGRSREMVVARELLQQMMAEAEVEGLSGGKYDQGEIEEGPNAGYKWETESGGFDQSNLAALYEVVCTVTAPSGRKYTLTYIRYDFT